MARLIKVLQLPKRGRYGHKNESARRQCKNRYAASHSSQRETLRKGQSPLLCTGFSHSACWQLYCLPPCWPVSLGENDGDSRSYVSSQDMAHVLSGKMMACHLAWVHPTGGSLRVFGQFAWLEVGSGKIAFSHPAHQRVTRAVRRLISKSNMLT
jgi:hypothetical protein